MDQVLKRQDLADGYGMDPYGFPAGSPGEESAAQPLPQENPVFPEDFHPEGIDGKVENKG